MRRTLLLLAVTGMFAAEARAQELDRARDLYANASYEEALSVLSASADPGNANIVDQYRALCLLALGRQSEAESTLEDLVLRAPGYRIDSGSVSPKLVDLYGRVRRRTLPAVAQRLYRDAKQLYDLGELQKAREGFVELADVLHEASADGASETITGLAQLSEGFRQLVDAQLSTRAEAERLEAATKAAVEAEQVARQVVQRAEEQARIYSSEDSDVTPPSPISRELPRWSPASGPASEMTFRGVFQVVVNEQGGVDAAKVVESIWPSYDEALLSAAPSWRFEPATKNGVPVKFALPLNIVLHPPERP